MSRMGAAYGLLCLADHGVWLVVKLLPGPTLLGLIRSRPWRRWRICRDESRRKFLFPRISSLLQRRCRRAGIASSCLSRSLLGRVLLDLIGVPHQLHLGMGWLEGTRKVPHAWLSIGERELSPGLDPGAGCRILTL